MEFESEIAAFEWGMRAAIEEAKTAWGLGEVPVGAVLYREGKIIGRAHNQRETSGRAIAHAEVLLLDKFNAESGAWRVPKGTVLIATLEPCLMCLGAMLSARIDTIVFGCADTRNAGMRLVKPWIEEGRFDHRPKVIEGVLAEESAELLTGFFSMRRMQAKNMRTEFLAHL